MMHDSRVDRQLDGHAGVVLRPRGAYALLVLAHGAGAGMRHAFMTELAAALADHGVATARWEFRYMTAGSPRPDRAEVAEASVRAVWNAVAKRERLPRFAGGKSFGGRMTSRAHAATPLAGLRGIVFFGFPLHPPDKPGVERAEHLARASGPLLFLQGTRDELADLALLRPEIARLGARAALHVVDGADHGFDVLVRSGRTHAEIIDELAATTASWIRSVLDT
jgi:hypothetical protein